MYSFYAPSPPTPKGEYADFPIINLFASYKLINLKLNTKNKYFIKF